MAAKGNKQPNQPPQGAAPDSGKPGGGKGRKDVTGVTPDNIRVDPDITEGHPGYQESGDSEIIPPPGSTKEKPAGAE
jgi:hypothetical protein